MRNRLRRKHLAMLGTLLFCVNTIPAHAATITVTNMNDNGLGSLRHALTVASNGDTINFAVTGTITLTSGGLPINKDITISGPGADQLSIDGNHALLVFGIFPGKTVTISGLTIRNAEAGAGVWNEQGTLAVSNCAITSNSYEGLLNDEGMLNVNNCVLSGNSYYGLYNYFGVTTVSKSVVSGNSSGGLVNDGPHHSPNDPIDPGSMTIADSMVSDNSGPGVSNVAGFLTVLNSTLSGNSAGEALNGGGILSGALFKTPADVTLVNSTISGNSAPDFGGGIAGGYWRVTIVNSTISGNSAGDSGGGISGTFVSIMNSTISGNSAGLGGGIYHYLFNLEISNTILNAGLSGQNIFNNGGTVTSHGYNISSDDGDGVLTGPSDQINTDPLLGPLQDNGGPTLTHLPLRGSPAIDAGDPEFTPPPDHDQRGSCFYRVFGRRIDVGSVETQPRPRCVTPAPRPTP